MKSPKSASLKNLKVVDNLFPRVSSGQNSDLAYY